MEPSYWSTSLLQYQGCALRKIIRSPKVPNYEIQGAQHKAYMSTALNMAAEKYIFKHLELTLFIYPLIIGTGQTFTEHNLLLL